MLAKNIFGLFQCLHHMALLSAPKDGATSLKTFSTKVEELNSFLKPALVSRNASFRAEVQRVNQTWLSSTLNLLRSHYSFMLKSLSSELRRSTSRVEDLRAAQQLAERWTRKNYKGKFNPVVFSAFRSLTDALLSSQVRVEDAVSRALAQLNAPPTTTARTPPSPPAPRQPPPPPAPTPPRSYAAAVASPPRSPPAVVSPPQRSPAPTLPQKRPRVSSPPSSPPLLSTPPLPQRKRVRRSPGSRFSPPAPQSPPPVVVSQSPPRPLLPTTASSASVHRSPTPAAPTRRPAPTARRPASATPTNSPFRVQPRRHPKTAQKNLEWSLPPLAAPVCVIGDSNLSRIGFSPSRNVQVESFPGCKAANLKEMCKRYKGPRPDVLIASVGINHRQQQVNTAESQVRALLLQLSKTFPAAKIVVPLLNFSRLLPPSEKTTLSAINRVLKTSKLVSTTPAIPDRDFSTGADLIHWSSETADSLMSAWVTPFL